MSYDKDDSQLDMFQGLKLVKAPEASKTQAIEQQGEDLLAILDLLRSIPWLPNPEEFVVDGVPETVIDARELANALGSMREFSNWIRHWKAEGFVFIEKIINNAGVVNPGRPTVDYWLRADCFKALIMRSKSPRSEEVRAHFVESHKKFSAGKVSQMVTEQERDKALPSRAPKNDDDKLALVEMALEGWKSARAEVQALKLQAEIEAPKVAVYERIAESKNLQAIRHVANKYNIPQNEFFEYLRRIGLLYQTDRWHAHADALRKGYFEDKETDSGYPQTKVTGAGITYIGTRLVKDGLLPWPKKKTGADG